MEAESSPSSAPFGLTLTYRGATHALSLRPDSTLVDLHDRIEELTSVRPANQKLIYKGSKKPASSTPHDISLLQAGLADGTRVQLVGPTAGELDGFEAAENEHQRRERILRERARRGTVKVRATGPSPAEASAAQYTFHQIQPLPHLPDPPAARALLARLAADPAIVHVMRKHRFSVGLLTELAPHEQPHLLGLNVNAGQAIKLRIRTNLYDGFRTYKEVRRVLCHELAHNVWGDHDNNFKELNSTLNREVAEFERAQAAGTHHLGSASSFDGPRPALEAEAQEYSLGGAYALGGSGVSSDTDSPEERRRKMLEATMNRLKKEEEEMEDRCGTAGH
ncbi:WLM-domain-containing protein [Epithele typhae]|uniref:WLM-domain-containing protein n=1 Tax=Epithele typhae TaxID=378194 RepID=UPI002007D557|nr:WLM-domain-containing protein [Epithele typhae]KAH9913557.1 WLM-domain-containing protein [Epithele typhae]